MNLSSIGLVPAARPAGRRSVVRLARTAARRAAVVPAVFAMLLAGASAAPAQEPFPLGQYRLDAWTAENGLRGNQVLPKLLQSPDGYLWMMARNGLTRFDGVNFTTYNADNTPLFRGSSNRQRPLLLDRQGRVLIATATGFVFYENGRFLEGPRYEGGMLQGAQDGDGTYWSLSTTGSLFRSVRTARGVRMEEFSHPGLPDAVASGIAVDGEGTLWVGFAEGGTVRIRHGGSARPTVRPFTTRDGLPSDAIIWVMAGQRGAIWISAPGTVTRVGGGAPPRVERVIDTGSDDEMHDVISLAEEPDGTTWLATTWSGLLRFDPRDGSMQRVTRSHGLAHDRVTSVYLDPHGSIWASTPLGLNRIRRVDFAAVSRPDSLALTANCVLRTPDGTGWLGTAAGELFRARGGISRVRWSVSRSPPRASSCRCRPGAAAPCGSPWAVGEPCAWRGRAPGASARTSPTRCWRTAAVRCGPAARKKDSPGCATAGKPTSAPRWAPSVCASRTSWRGVAG
jgi:streptogramin lyase